MTDRVKQLLEDKINDIFLIIQDEENITDGDITPLMYLELDRQTEKLANIICDVIEYQK